MPVYSGSAVLREAVYCPKLNGRATASTSPGDFEYGGMGEDDGEAGEVLGMTKAELKAPSDVFGESAEEVSRGPDGDGSDQDHGDAGDVLEEASGGGGGPTQVLSVPDLRTRDTGEHLGIQVMFRRLLGSDRD